MKYNKDQWISSFEDQLSILRPHLTPRVLATMSLSAWHRFGRRDEDPIEAARAWHDANTAAEPPKPVSTAAPPSLPETKKATRRQKG